MYIEIYQNKKCVYKGFTHAETLGDVCEEFGRDDKPLPGTHQGRSLINGDIVRISYNDKASYDKAREFSIGTDSVYEYVGGMVFKPANPVVASSIQSFEDMDGVKVVMMQPGFPAVVTRIRSTLKELQNAVSDHREPSLIEYSFPYPDSVMILGNEEAKLINMPLNRTLNDEVYAGTIFVVKDDQCGNLIDLSDVEIDRYLQKHGAPEKFDEKVLDTSPYLKFFGYYD